MREQRRLAEPPPEPGAAGMIAELEPPAADHFHPPAALRREDRTRAQHRHPAVARTQRTADRGDHVALDAHARPGQRPAQPLGRRRHIGAREPQHRRARGGIRAGAGQRRRTRGQHIGARGIETRPDIGGPGLAAPEHPPGRVADRRAAAAAAAVDPEIELHAASSPRRLAERRRRESGIATQIPGRGGSISKGRLAIWR